MKGSGFPGPISCLITLSKSVSWEGSYILLINLEYTLVS